MLKLRIVTALIALAILLAVVFLAPPVVAYAAIALLVMVGAQEWSGLLREEKSGLRWTYVAIIGLLLIVTAALGSPWTEVVLMAALVWWLCAFVWVMFYPTAVPGFVAWLAGACVLLPLFVALLALYKSGAERLLFVLVIVWAADVGAYFAGKLFGRVKLAPQISPGKTWEGVLGGLVMVGIVSYLGAGYFGIDPLVLVPFCLGVACLSVVGDLTVSIFKRNAGVKDSGTVFPGHGGILDRVDSVAAAAPVFALGTAVAGLS